MQQTRTEIERNPFKNEGEERKRGKSEQHGQQSTKNDNNTIFEFSTQGSNQSNHF